MVARIKYLMYVVDVPATKYFRRLASIKYLVDVPATKYFRRLASIKYHAGIPATTYLRRLDLNTSQVQAIAEVQNFVG